MCCQGYLSFSFFFLIHVLLSNLLTVDRSNVKTENSSNIAHSSILLEKKYDEIRTEAIKAGILLKETNEKVDEIINDGHIIKSHAYGVRINALRFYQSLTQSGKINRYCQLVFIIIIITVSIIFIGKFF